jgi:hypothetical protein
MCYQWLLSAVEMNVVGELALKIKDMFGTGQVYCVLAD